MTQMTLAKKLGVSFQQLQKYEKGTNRIGSGRLQRAAAALGLPITAFFPADPGATKRSESDALTALVGQPHAARLLTAFHAIADKQRRLALVRLAEGMARGGRRSTGQRV
jgi:transcriptional regulator with XRE-family HTH domain